MLAQKALVQPLKLTLHSYQRASTSLKGVPYLTRILGCLVTLITMSHCNYLIHHQHLPLEWYVKVASLIL